MNHANVIVDDSQYLDEPFFQDGPVSQAVNAASAAGVAVFSAAGNENIVVGGNNVSSYETPAFRPASCPASVTAAEGNVSVSCHDFDTTAGTDTGDDITLAPGGGLGIDLQWAQPWGPLVHHDYDAFLLDSTTQQVLAGSALDQDGGFTEPVEFFGYTNEGASAQTVQVVIVRYSGGSTDRLKFVMVGSSGITSVQYNTSIGGDIVGPTIFGHNGAATDGSTAAIRVQRLEPARGLLVTRPGDALLPAHPEHRSAARTTGARQARLRRHRRRAKRVLRRPERQ